MEEKELILHIVLVDCGRWGDYLLWQICSWKWTDNKCRCNSGLEILKPIIDGMIASGGGGGGIVIGFTESADPKSFGVSVIGRSRWGW